MSDKCKAQLFRIIPKMFLPAIYIAATGGFAVHVCVLIRIHIPHLYMVQIIIQPCTIQ